jgi:hypothetical protein
MFFPEDTVLDTRPAHPDEAFTDRMHLASRSRPTSSQARSRWPSRSSR